MASIDFTKIDDATNGIADVVAKLRASIKTGMSAADVAAAQATADAVEARLRSIAADPDNPVPPEEPAFASAKRK